MLESNEVLNESPSRTPRHAKVRHEINLFSQFLDSICEILTENDISQTSKIDLQRILAWFIIDCFVHNLGLISTARQNFRPQTSDDEIRLADQTDYKWYHQWSHL